MTHSKLTGQVYNLSIFDNISTYSEQNKNNSSNQVDWMIMSNE